MTAPLRAGIVGWGLAGRCFHGPFLQTSPHYDLRYVVTRRTPDPALYPKLTRLASLDALLARDDVDVVVIATPHRLHVPQALASLASGRAVIVEKPVAPSPAAWERLRPYAEAKRLFPYHNRRWDADFLTVQAVIAAGTLGRVYHLENRWPYYRPTAGARVPWKDDPAQLGGVLYDLMPHLIDQTLALFGPPTEVFVSGGVVHPDRRVLDVARAQFQYADGRTALLEIDMLNADLPPRFQVRGLRGTFTRWAGDPQEARLRAGDLPGGAAWGHTDTGGTLHTAEGAHAVPGQAGDYAGFYTAVARAITADGPPPIPPEAITQQLTLLQTMQARLRRHMGDLEG